MLWQEVGSTGASSSSSPGPAAAAPQAAAAGDLGFYFDIVGEDSACHWPPSAEFPEGDGEDDGLLKSLQGAWCVTEEVTCDIAGSICTFSNGQSYPVVQDERGMVMNKWHLLTIEAGVATWARGKRRLEWRRPPEPEPGPEDPQAALEAAGGVAVADEAVVILDGEEDVARAAQAAAAEGEGEAEVDPYVAAAAEQGEGEACPEPQAEGGADGADDVDLFVVDVEGRGPGASEVPVVEVAAPPAAAPRADQPAGHHGPGSGRRGHWQRPAYQPPRAQAQRWRNGGPYGGSRDRGGWGKGGC